jgi:hypothetical protein
MTGAAQGHTVLFVSPLGQTIAGAGRAMAAGAAKMDAIARRIGNRRRQTPLGQRQNTPEKQHGGKQGDFNEGDVRHEPKSPRMEQMAPIKMRRPRVGSASAMRMMNEHFSLPK